MGDPAQLLLTRPSAAAERFLAALEAAHGAPIPAILSPVLAIRPLPVTLAVRPAALILTSENGAARVGELGFGGLPAWCVGPRTAEVARGQGAHIARVAPDAEHLLPLLLAERPSGLLLHLRGEHARVDVAARLRAAGLAAEDAVVYQQQALPPTPGAHAALMSSDPLVAPLFSPRSAMLLAGWRPRAPLRIVALSRAVAETAMPLRPVSLVVAAAPDGDAMVEATLRMLTEDRPPAAAAARLA